MTTSAWESSTILKLESRRDPATLTLWNMKERTYWDWDMVNMNI